MNKNVAPAEVAVAPRKDSLKKRLISFLGALIYFVTLILSPRPITRLGLAGTKNYTIRIISRYHYCRIGSRANWSKRAQKNALDGRGTEIQRPQILGHDKLPRTKKKLKQIGLRDNSGHQRDLLHTFPRDQHPQHKYVFFLIHHDFPHSGAPLFHQNETQRRLLQ